MWSSHVAFVLADVVGVARPPRRGHRNRRRAGPALHRRIAYVTSVVFVGRGDRRCSRPASTCCDGGRRSTGPRYVGPQRNPAPEGAGGTEAAHGQMGDRIPTRAARWLLRWTRWTDDELTVLALVVDVRGAGPPRPTTPCPGLDQLLSRGNDGDPGLLPGWYMPTPMTRRGPGWRTPVVVAIVAAFVAHRGLRPVQHLRSDRSGLTARIVVGGRFRHGSRSPGHGTCDFGCSHGRRRAVCVPSVHNGRSRSRASAP